MTDTIEIIIPTTATQERKSSLLEAIDSVLAQTDVTVSVIVVVNGSIYDVELYEYLEQRDDIKFHYEKLGSLPNAIWKGRSLVSASYFGFLDDDDLLLEGALRARVFGIKTADMIAGNGFFDRQGEKQLMRKSFEGCSENPLEELLRSNWLASCGGLYRTKTVGAEYFFDLPKYFEWTYVAFSLAYDNKTLNFLNIPTFYVRDSSVSLSKEEGNPEALVDFLKRLMERPMSRSLKKKLKLKIGSAYHSISVKYLDLGSVRASFIMHLKSLNCLGNMKYLTYSSRFLKVFSSSRDNLAS